MASAKSFRSALRKARRESGGKSIGCTCMMISTLESELGAALPETYKEFLTEIGVNAGEEGTFLAGSDLRFCQLLFLQKKGREFIENHRGPSVPEDAFFFSTHLHYSYLFFHLGDDDPAVFLYHDGDPRNFTKVSSHFTDWLVESVAQYYAELT